MPIGYDWRDLALTFNGYAAAGGSDECFQISESVQDRHRSGTPLTEFTLEELRTALFFSARADRHSGDYRDENPFEEAIVAELVRRMGVEWIEGELKAEKERWK